MKKSLSIVLIAVFTVLSVVFCILYFMNSADLNREIAKLQTELKASGENNETLTAGVMDRDTQIAELNTELEKKEEELAGKELELESALSTLSDKKAELESVSADLSSKEVELASIAAELESMNTELDRKTGEAEELAAQVASQAEQILVLQEKSNPVVPDKPGIYDSAKFFLQALDENSINYSYLGNDSDGIDAIRSRWTLDELQVDVMVYFLDNEHMAIRIWDTIEIPQDNLTRTMIVCDYCNCTYKYAAFYINIDREINTVTVREDIILSNPAEAGTTGYKIFRIVIDIIDDCERKLLACTY